MSCWFVRCLALVTGLACLSAASPAFAQVQPLDASHNVSSTAPGLNNGSVTIAGQTPSAGSNRLLVVAVVMELSAANTLVSLTASFGGTAMTPIATTGATNAREHAALFYLPDSQIAAGNLVVAYNVAGGGTDVTGLHVHWGSCTGVDQTSPINDSSQSYNTGNTVTFGSQVNYLADGRVVYAAGNGGTPATMTAPAGPPAFAQSLATTTSGHSSFIAQTAVLAADASYAAGTTVTFGGTTQARSAIAVAALRPSRADLSVTKTDGTATYVPGATTTYTIVASNAGPSNVTGATLADTFPAIVTSAGWTCAGAGGATCPAPSGSGNLNVAVNLPAGGSLTYTVAATTSSAATGNLVNAATIAAPAGTSDPTPGNNTATDTDTPSPQADLRVVKSGPASAFSGDPAAYTIAFTNAGPSNVTGATIADVFPADLLGATWTCAGAGGATCPAASGSGNIAASANLPSGGSLTYTATATISSTFTGNLVNTATIAPPGGTPDPVAGNNSSSATTAVVSQTQVADVSVTKTGPAGPLAVGSNVTYTILVTNGGPATAQNVTLSDPLPPGMTWVSTTPSVGTCSGTATVTCGFGAMANGATATVTIVATITALGTKSNTVTVSNLNGSDYDPDPTNDRSTWLTTVSGALACGTPGGPGPGGTLSGVVNTYYPGTSSVSAGQANTCIPVGAAQGAAVGLTSGDLLLVIQMQDATINSTNTINYGGANGTGAGALVVNAGRYEYVTARDVIGGGGCAAGQIPISGTGANGGLLNGYANSDATTTQGQARFQVVRVPQYTTATLTGATPVTALAWQTDNCNPASCSTNGLGWGGIVALDVSGALTINTGVAVNVDGLGFRGAAGRWLTGGAGTNTDYRALSTITTNGGKGEGNAGTPEWVYDAAGTSRSTCAQPLLNTYLVQTLQPNDGYPNGSMARGAPGNAGGGSTDDNPAANDRNSGGGGGSNGGAGGRGGFSWSTGLDRGGLGAAVTPAISQLVLGGGGGAGTRNNTNCGGLDPVTGAQDAQASSGAAGGGLIAIRAGTLTIAAGAILSANGSAAYNLTLRDGGGGGGAGGSIVLTATDATLDMANLTLRANGGRGGDSWRNQPAGGATLGNRHGPGGGGGGGVIAHSATAGAPVLSVTGGQPGLTTTAADTFGALAGGTGQTLTATPDEIPGTGSGAECPPPDPDPTITLTHSETTVSMGGPVSVFSTVTNVSPFTSAVGSPTFGTVTATLTLDPGLLSLAVASAPGWSCSIAGPVVTCTRSTALSAQQSYPTIEITATVGPSVIGPTTLTNTASVSGGGDVNLANNTATDAIGVRAPTLAHIRVFEALRRGPAVVLRWRTSFELNNLGFRVHREAGGVRELITPQILAGSVFVVGKDRQLPSGRSYAWIDREPAADSRYWLEDIDVDGSRRWSGPAVPVDGPGEGGWGRDTVSSSPTLSRLGRDRAGQGRWQGPRGIGIRRRLPVPPGPRTRPWNAPSQPAAKLLVAQEGWYRVTKAELLAAGFDPGPISSSLQLLVDGAEQAILVQDGGEGSFDASDAVEFYATGFDSPWDGTHVYWLVAGDGPGMRIKPGLGGDAPFPPTPPSFPFTVELRERTVQILELPGTGDEENFFGAIVTTEPVAQQLTLSNVDLQAAGEATLEVALQGGLDAPHRVGVQLNGNDVSTVEFAGQERSVETLGVPVSWLREGVNEVTLVARGGDEDVSLVDYVRITYPHLYALDDGALRMTAPALTRVALGGLTDRSLRVVDLTRPSQPRELEVSFASEETGVTASVAVSRLSAATLYAFTPERVLSPVRIAVNAPSRWARRDNAADFLIIGHPSLLARLEPLREHRQQEGLVTSIVDVTDVYDEFAYGQKTPFAIRDFLKRATRGWRHPPRYVLLAGDASFDPRNYLGEGDYDLVPTKLVRTVFMKTDSDDWFVDWDADGLPELAVGRLPARTAGEAVTMVGKILARDAASAGGTTEWARRVLLVAAPADEYDFPAANARLRALLPPDVAAEEVAIGPLGPVAARAAIVSGFDAGQLLVSFTGHGSTDVWMERTDGGLVFSGADASALTNGAALPVVVAMTCLNGLFDDLWTESLAEALLKAPAGGAAAVWASSGLTEPSSQAPMNEELFRLLFGGAPLRLGDALVRAKAATADGDARRTWILFGDPTMTVR